MWMWFSETAKVQKKQCYKKSGESCYHDGDCYGWNDSDREVKCCQGVCTPKENDYMCELSKETGKYVIKGTNKSCQTSDNKCKKSDVGEKCQEKDDCIGFDDDYRKIQCCGTDGSDNTYNYKKRGKFRC